MVDSAAVSSHHLAVWLERGVVWVADLGSTNGTFVDGRRLEGPAAVKRTAQVRLGSVPLDIALLVERLATAQRRPQQRHGDRTGIGLRGGRCIRHADNMAPFPAMTRKFRAAHGERLRRFNQFVRPRRKIPS